MVAPAGFAPYDLQERPAGTSVQHFAMSPEGVLFRVRTVPNQPPQQLGFWTEALRTQLTREGYTYIDTRELSSPLGAVVLLRWSVTVGQSDWLYLTALAELGDQLVIAEAAGDVTLLGEYEAGAHRQPRIDGSSCKRARGCRFGVDAVTGPLCRRDVLLSAAG